jgi:hypothetical protein
VNLLLLVEAARTEPRVYRDWLKQRFPALVQVDRPAALGTSSYCIISGKGYPSMERRITGLVRDLEARPGTADHFWICVDSEESGFAERHAAVERAVEKAVQGTAFWERNPLLRLRIIVQHCCIETWFLGHRGFGRARPPSALLAEFKRFYDVSVDDPEHMGCPPRYVTRQSFHERYLREMLAAHGKRYTKEHPGIVTDASYFAALVERCEETGHLQSFRYLLEAFGECGPA